MPPAVAAVGQAAFAAAAAVGTSVATASAVASFAATVATTAITTAALSAAQFLFARTQTDRAGGNVADAPASINAPDVRGTIRQAVPPAPIVFGRMRFGGAFILHEVIPPFLYLQHVHSVVPVSDYRTLYVGTEEVPLSAAGEPLTPPFLTSAGDKRLLVKTQDGSDTQGVNPLIQSDFITAAPAGFEEIDANYKTPGWANAVTRWDYGANFTEHEALYGQVPLPEVEWLIDGARVPDPRKPGHVLDFDPTDPASFYAAEATWDWSNTAALIQAYWAMMDFGLGAGPGRMDHDAIAAAADFDEEVVALATGPNAGQFVKRHTVDGVVLLDQKPNTVMEAMLTANRGFVVQQGGRFIVSSSQPRDPVMTITEDMLAGGFRYRNVTPKRDRVNVASVKFIDPARDYKDNDGPVLRRADLITAHGEELAQPVTLGLTVLHQRAQWIVKAFVDDAQLGRKLTLRTNLKLLGIEPGTVVRVWFDNYPAVNAVYEVDEWTLNEDLTTMDISLAEYDASIPRAWNPANDEVAFEQTAA